MATLTTFTNRLLVAGGFAVAAVAAPVVVALSASTAPAGPALAECPSTELKDPITGACQPFNDVAPPTQNPINPEGAPLEPGSITSGLNVGQLPEVNGIPCTGGNTGQCIGLEQSKGANNVELPSAPIGVQP
jgi:hypothetical protein